MQWARADQCSGLASRADAITPGESQTPLCGSHLPSAHLAAAAEQLSSLESGTGEGGPRALDLWALGLWQQPGRSRTAWLGLALLTGGALFRWRLAGVAPGSALSKLAGCFQPRGQSGRERSHKAAESPGCCGGQREGPQLSPGRFRRASWRK